MKLLPITSGEAGGNSGSLLRREPIKIIKLNEASTYKILENRVYRFIKNL